MSVQIDIQKKPKVESVEKIKLNSPCDVYNLKEIQAIKEAIQEHLIFIGLDYGNNLRTLNFLSIGKSNVAYIDSKDIIRTALLNACDNVIIVHNHPANNLEPSNFDKQFTNKINKMLKIFNINLLDNIIVTEESYNSMKQCGYIDKEYIDKDIKYLENTLLIEENKILKEKIKNLEKRRGNKREKSNLKQSSNEIER